MAKTPAVQGITHVTEEIGLGTPEVISSLTHTDPLPAPSAEF